MADACVISAYAVSPLGEGGLDVLAPTPGQPAKSAITRDSELESAGLKRPFAARSQVFASDDDRATALLTRALEGALRSLDAARPSWRSERVGVALGSSSGGMKTAERLFERRPLEANEADLADPELARIARAATYFAPFDEALSRVGLNRSVTPLRSHVLTACSASTLAMGLGKRWLERGACDVAIVGGYDAVSVFVAAGFEALRATTATHPRPFRVGRDGMSLGEGAGVVVMVREPGPAPVLFRVAGFGASTDAVHITAPDRTGGGLARAARAALDDAGLRAEHIDLVSAHATATPFNDPMEARALGALFGDVDLERAGPVVQPLKAQIGHTLGAAGVLETMAAAAALASQVAPAAAGDGELDPEARVRLLERAEPARLANALKLSAAFGGANAALVLSVEPGSAPRRVARRVFARGEASVDSSDLVALAEATGIARDRLARLDTIERLGVAAVAKLAGELGRDALEGAGVVVGHSLATIDTNHRFFARKLDKGAASVEPRLFPATSPNAVAGQCAIAFGLTGPGLSVGRGLDGAQEALEVGAELVAAGDAPKMVVVTVEDGLPLGRLVRRLAGFGDAPPAGARATLLSCEAAASAPEIALVGGLR